MKNLKEYYIWEKGEGSHLNEYFHTSEFECKCKREGCTITRVSKELVEALFELRKFAGPVKITSAYRCKRHNKLVGGTKTSRHTKGEAADVQCVNLFPNNVQDYALKYLKKWIRGVGRYDTFTHLDSRTRPTVWDRRSKKEQR